MNQVPIKLGPLALLLTVISICLTTLSILTFTTARADMRLAEKYGQTVETRYALEREGQAYLEEVSDAIRQGQIQDLADVEIDERGILWKTFEMNESKLRIGLAVTDEDYSILSWKQEKEWNQDIEIGNLWQ